MTSNRKRSRFAKLSPRQWKIAQFVTKGDRNADIAIQINATEDVVKNELRNIYDLVGCWNRVELALAVVRHEYECKTCDLMGEINEETCCSSTLVL